VVVTIAALQGVVDPSVLLRRSSCAEAIESSGTSAVNRVAKIHQLPFSTGNYGLTWTLSI
jgi:hypothetical protein